MRRFRTVIILALAVSAFAACKKRGGYMTDPVVVATP